MNEAFDASALKIHDGKNLPGHQLTALFNALDWSSGKYPEKLVRAVANSHTVRSLWDGETLIGLVTAISDGELCAYFPYVAIHPAYQGRSLGRMLFQAALEPYRGFHHVSLISYADKEGFYLRNGFVHDPGKKALFVKTHTA